MRKNTNHGRGEAGGLPSGWARVALEDLLLRVVGGGTPARNVPQYFDGDIPWFTVKDMKSLRPLDAEEHITQEAIDGSATNLIPAGTLIVATRIALGRAMRPKVTCAINQDLKALFFGQGVCPDFMLYWVAAHERFIQELGSGTTVSGIRLETLNGLVVDLPPAAEQTRIVAKLEALLTDLDAGVAELKAAQKKLVRYRQSLLKAAVEGALTAAWRAARSAPLSPRGRGAGGEGAAQGPHPLPNPSPVKGEGLECETGAQLLARILTERRARWEDRQRAKFAAQGKTPPKGWQVKYPEPAPPDTTGLPELPQGWVWASVEQLTEFITSGSRGWADYYADAGAMFIRSQNINKDWLDLSDVVRVNPPKGSEGARTRVQKDDVLLTITGANVGKAAQVEAAIDEAYVSQHVALIRPVDVAVSKVLHLFFTAEAGGRGQLNKEAYGAGKPGLNLQQVAGVCVPLASAAEFETLINIVKTQLDAATAKEVAIELALKQSTAQRQNLLRAAFAGELVPQDPADEPASSLLARIRAERAAQGVASKPRGRKVKGVA